MKPSTARMLVFVMLVMLTAFLPRLPLFGQGFACFESAPALEWEDSDIGVVNIAASRATPANAFELCSISQGFGPTVDQVRFLSRPLRAEFEVRARLDALNGPGLGGLMARLDARTGNYPYVQISASRSRTGGLVLLTGYRPNAGEPASGGGLRSIPIELPVWLQVRREAGQMVTAYSRDGRDFQDYLRVKIAGSQLESFFFSGGMVQASQGQAPSTAVFASPSVTTKETQFPPVLLSVTPPNSPLEGGVRVTILGRGFAGIRSVSLAGIPAKIVHATDDSLAVQAGPSPKAAAGDVVVAGPDGEESLENAFVYLGHTFVRGDSSGDREIDIGDPVGVLAYLFVGGRAPQCIDAADVDADGSLDIGDPVGVLTYLFLGGRPPAAPFPAPGLSPSPSEPCGMPAAPRILDVSPRDLVPGAVVTIKGEGFSRIPEENLVYFGSSPVQILEASPTMLRGKTGNIGQTGRVPATILQDITLSAQGACKTKGGCFSLQVGLAGSADGILVNLKSADARVLGSAKADAAKPGNLVLHFDAARWNPDNSYAVRGRFNVPALTGLSRGSLLLDFEYLHSTPEIKFDEWVQGLANELNRKINGGGEPQEIKVAASREAITIELRSEIASRGGGDWQESAVDVVAEDALPESPCGPLSPVSIPREFGWCLFEDLIKDCGGLPSFEYFIPKHLVFQASNAIFPLPSPNNWSPAQKDVLYSRDAYCHVRTKGLYKTCVLDSYAGCAKGQTRHWIPRFPGSAMLLKTRWVSEAQMQEDGKTLSKHYSYVHGGTRWYLTLLHLMYKRSVDSWFFVDFYVAQPGGYGGCGASGADRPASITGVWANYAMCTNNQAGEADDACGNSMIDGECNRNCSWCHFQSQRASGNTNACLFTGQKRVFLDFVRSIGSGAISGPPACP